jgi:hypothetical protein
LNLTTHKRLLIVREIELARMVHNLSAQPKLAV